MDCNWFSSILCQFWFWFHYVISEMVGKWAQDFCRFGWNSLKIRKILPVSSHYQRDIWRVALNEISGLAMFKIKHGTCSNGLCLCFMSWLWEWVVLYTLPILILISEPILLMMWLVFSYVIFIDWIWIFCAVTYGDPKNIVNFVYCSKLWDLRNSTGIRVWRIWEIVTYSFRRSHSWILHKCKPYRWIT